jgi:Arc/MetJ-type ribon-helix-helix transcriptional regulator
MLTLEASSYADFTQFLFASGYKLGKIEAGFYALEKARIYDAVIISIPKNINLKPKEIEVLEEYVRTGGSLLIIGSRGGEYLNRTNINELTRKFGFEFFTDDVNDSVNYVNLQKRPLLTNFKSHYITENIKKIVLSSACSLSTLGFVEDEKNIQVEVLVRGGLNCWRNKFEEQKWVEEDSPKLPLLVAVNYYKGKVVAFGTLSIFSSLGREYGFSAFDNDIIIANILRWLTLDVESEGQVVTIDLQKDLFYWANSIVKEKRWNNLSDLVNVGLKHFKDNYNSIIKELKEVQQERYQRKREYKEAAKEEKEEAEEKVIDLIPKRKKEDLEDIISAIENASGETFERSFKPGEEEFTEETKKNTPEVSSEELPDDLNSLTVKELKSYCKKHEINLPTKARKADIIKILLYVLDED